MNFRRIQIIFLITFIAIDIFLFGMFQQNLNMQAENVSKGNTDSTIVKEMKDDQIDLGKLSTSTGSGFYLAGSPSDTLRNQIGQLINQTPHYVGHQLMSELKQPINVDKNNPAKTINNLLSDPTFILNGSQYVYNKTLSSPQMIVYTQKAMGKQILSAEGQIRFNLNTSHQILSYTQTYLDGIKNLREKAATISEQRALIWLYQYNEIPNNSKVEWIQQGYTKLLSVDSDQVLIPTWVIAIKPQNSTQIQIKRINAFNGGIIKDSNQNIQSNYSAVG